MENIKLFGNGMLNLMQFLGSSIGSQLFEAFHVMSTAIKCALWFPASLSGPNANKTPYLRTSGLALEPLAGSTASVTQYRSYNCGNESYFAFVCDPAQFSQEFFSAADSIGGASFGVVSGYVEVEGRYLLFPSRGAAYVLPGPSLAIRVELIGQLREVF